MIAGEEEANPESCRVSENMQSIWGQQHRL